MLSTLKKRWSSKSRRKKIRALMIIGMILMMSVGIYVDDDYSPFFFTVSSAYNVIEENNVDADSNIDAVANIGDDGATSFTDAQTVNAVDQIITEGNGAGYVAGIDDDEIHDAITDNHSPTDIGTYSSDANMQQDNNVYNTLTEADTGGAGVSEYIFVDGISTAEISWLTVGTSPYLDAQDQPTNLLESTNGAISSWYTFGATTGSGTGFTVNASIYDSNVGDSFIVWEIDWTNDGTADATGSFASQSTFAWQNTGTITGLDTATEINDARIKFIYDKGGGGPDLLTLDASRLGVSQSGGANYEFDREFSFTSIATLDGNTEELAINTGTMGTESLIVQVWEVSAWVTVVTLLDANDNVWINTSIATWMDSATEDFRFLGGTETSDITLNTWDIDMVLIHNVKNEVLDYELQWEHQSTSVDAKKDTYNITVFGSATEDMEIQTWNIGGSSWNTALTPTIKSTEQWYNMTVDANAIGTTITWRYRGTSESGDSIQSILNIDYSGVTAWNFTVNIIELSFDIPDYKQASGDIGFPENPLTINVSSGIIYNIQVRAVDGSGTPIVNNYVFFDTDSNPSGYIQLTTSYQNLYTSLGGLDGRESSIWLWINVPFGINDAVLTFTLWIQIVKA